MTTCSCNFDSQIAYINDNPITIVEYLNDKKIQKLISEKKEKLFCEAGNELIKYETIKLQII